MGLEGLEDFFKTCWEKLDQDRNKISKIPNKKNKKMMTYQIIKIIIKNRRNIPLYLKYLSKKIRYKTNKL